MDLFQAESPSDNRGGERADAALLRRLAARNAPWGTARLRPGRRTPAKMAALLDEAARLRRQEGDRGAALALLDAQAPVIEACAVRARDEGGAKLPAWRGRPRLLVALKALCAGDGPVTEGRLLEAVSELDDLQPLSQDELWAVPEALRVALTEALLHAARVAVDHARQRVAARRWVRMPVGDPIFQGDNPRGIVGFAKGETADVTILRIGTRHLGDAFLAQALKEAEAEARPAARRRLDDALSRRALSAEAVVARAQAGEAAMLLRLENLLAGRRTADALNWQACFVRLSRVDRALRQEAAGTYACMDDDSRAEVRRQVSVIARAARLPELSVARAAVDAARSGKDLRHEVCWWLCDDAGRRALLSRLGRDHVRLRRRTPDPTGRRTVSARLLLAAALALPLSACAGSPWLWPACALLGWGAADLLAGRFFADLTPPARLLKLDGDHLPPDCRTLVTMPVLLSSPKRAEEVCAQLEALGCLEASEDIEYLLLGDLCDAPNREMPGDGDVLDRARACVDAMNARAGREKYALLCRERSLLKADGVWMGRDRKRGALMDLNRLLLGREGAESAFGAEGNACGRLRNRFRFVITLDADTRALPGDLRRLIGALAHPLNRPREDRGYAVLQPRMEALPSACVNGFVRLFAGAGGLTAYPVCASNLWQDLTGRGIYGGKGIYDVAAFQARVEGSVPRWSICDCQRRPFRLWRNRQSQRGIVALLPEGRVLSHDLAEGALAGAGFVGDVAFYDGHPSTLAATLRRRHRWTRGDWQLLPVMLSPKRPLSLADRFRMLDNLVRSLWAPALLALLTGGAWAGNPWALGAALGLAWLEPVLHLGDGDALKWRRATARLALLPLSAFNALDAVGRTLWRLAVSGKHLMQWVTAADAEERPDRLSRLPGVVAALLLVPALSNGCFPAVLIALGALFLIGPGWIGDMEAEEIGKEEPLTDAQREVLMDLARRTWRFFEENTNPEDSPLPPDNVQLEPPVGAARRTSPTNIALYLLSCLSARRLGFIGVDEARRRIAATLDALEHMEKWRGQLYNWYDIDTLAPLRPRYVSSVDSGNLAAALLLCANAPEAGEDLSRRLRALAEGMDLAALYDSRRELFAIGYDVDSGKVSQSHYDLLASESRILSFTAMILNQVPATHWLRLGRPCAAVGGGTAPLSWSGTMFEYLLPELFLSEPPMTLLGEGVRAAVAAQIEQGRHRGRPWGVSESGHSALDAAMNYQYRAFGLRALALDGEACEDVVAPYASALAALVAPGAAADNLMRMIDMGWVGRWGLYEAADYRRHRGAPTLVMSHMAHHQGMVLCALCEVLTGHSLRADFMGQPRVRALSLLLEERAGTAGARRPSRRAGRPPRIPRDQAPSLRELAGRQARLREFPRRGEAYPQTHLLYGGGMAALCTDDGGLHGWRENLAVTRYAGALLNRRDMARVWLVDADDGSRAPLAGPAVYAPGTVRYFARVNRLEAVMDVCLSPEDCTLLKMVEVRNAGESPAYCAVADVAPLALCNEADWRAHAAFQGLFVEGECVAPDGPPDGLLFRRRPGSRGAEGPRLAMLAAGEGALTWECDYGTLAGRTGDAGATDVLTRPLSGGTGATLNPAGALRKALSLAPGQSARVWFALGLLDGDASAEEWLARWRQPRQAERALRLAGIRAGSMLDFLDLDAAGHHLLQRMAALLVDGHLASRARGSRRGEAGASRAALWSMGLSGDRPMLVMAVDRASDDAPVRALIRAHGFYRAMGLDTDLVLVDDGGSGYDRPIRDRLDNLISASHLNRLRCAPGGVWLLEGGHLDGEQRRALERFASASFLARRDFDVQAREHLSALSGSRGKCRYRPMDPGECRLAPQERLMDNGYGGFLGAEGYAIDLLPDRLPPAPWCNVLANDAGGMLLSERGGGFFWQGNSRSGRLTPYGNDGLWEGWGLMLYLLDDARREALPLLPGEQPRTCYRVIHSAQSSCYTIDDARLRAEVRFSMHPDRAEAQIGVTLENRRLRSEEMRLVGYVNWLMGVDARDAVALNGWHEDGACFVTGAAAGVGWFAAADALAGPGPDRCAFLGRGGFMNPEGGSTLSVPLRLKRGGECELRLALGWSGDVDSARRRVLDWRSRPEAAPATEPVKLTLKTPDAALDALANGFLLHQIRAARVLGRTGLYQPGGAWGFRDQLQDMLALIHHEPERVRAHLLRCASHQFEAGDVMHWWHAPFTGVRTRVSDDMLFLPWVTAAYVTCTGDVGVLSEKVAYLEDVPIPEGREDVCGEMWPGSVAESLHGHCMRAFRRACRTGAHGLLLMGAGDWNDGMNRVGAEGAGESVWLTQFAIACADRYRRIAPEEVDRVWLWRTAETLRQAVEAHGWDGGWYLRAYDDRGAPLGGAGCAECRIDAISQAWATLCGLDENRCDAALDAAWRMLADREAGIIRLLTPPFDGHGPDPGYIRGYPPGVRENGGQYTHGALWLLLALIRRGDGERAHEALQMLLPYNHSDTPQKAEVYRVEPYVMAADVYDRQGGTPGLRGRGGWTWYTGSAAWMYVALLALLGYERRGSEVRLNALLGDWPRAAVTVAFGDSRYHLVCDRETERVTLDGQPVDGDFINMTDDGGEHEARFPARIPFTLSASTP